VKLPRDASALLKWNQRISGTARATKADRLGSFPSRVTPKTWKTVLAACPVSCSALMGGCKETIDARYSQQPSTCHKCSIHCDSWWVAHGANKQRWAPQTTHDTPKRVHKLSMNVTEKSLAVNFRQIYFWARTYFFRKNAVAPSDFRLLRLWHKHYY